MFRSLIVAAALVAVPSFAFAGKADADACAAKLTGQSKVIYRASVAYAVQGDSLEQAVTKATKPKVQAGRLSENDARRFGREAANCVRLVYRKA
ncbi:hypothetical protein [Flaviflagellibacter deserti]|uniref:Uncharacterized protein n=1 Tax=Flaviflagellibacter deserti TaxID=2267266 RepID=A0ABV9Z070_9HYPH